MKDILVARRSEIEAESKRRDVPYEQVVAELEAGLAYIFSGVVIPMTMRAQA